MSRLNKKREKERGDKEILEAIFKGNVTCTSMELKQTPKGSTKESSSS